MDYISLHQYFDGHEKPVESFLAQADEMSDYIKDCDISLRLYQG